MIDGCCPTIRMHEQVGCGRAFDLVWAALRIEGQLQPGQAQGVEVAARRGRRDVRGQCCRPTELQPARHRAAAELLLVELQLGPVQTQLEGVLGLLTGEPDLQRADGKAALIEVDRQIQAGLNGYLCRLGLGELDACPQRNG